jgi:hypothetical protein
MTRIEEEKYEEKLVNIAKNNMLLNQRVYFSMYSDIEKYGPYATFRGFINNYEGIQVAVSFIKEPFKLLLFHPSRIEEFLK